MDLLKNKKIFITGATKGIGKGIAYKFAENGADLVLNGRNIDELNIIKTDLERSYGITVIVVPYDVTDENKIKDAFKTIKSQFGYIDCLINNAGVMEDRLLGMIDSNNIDITLNTNLKAVILHTQYASRMMQRKKSGSIVNISSIIGVNGNAGQVVYSASKAGVIGVTKSAAKELASYNVRVNSIAPGFIDSDMTRSLSDDKYQERVDRIKMNRVGTPEDIANVAMFLCSDLSLYVTGQVIGVDGGMLI